jgi:hypothetical protein
VRDSVRCRFYVFVERALVRVANHRCLNSAAERIEQRREQLTRAIKAGKKSEVDRLDGKLSLRYARLYLSPGASNSPWLVAMPSSRLRAMR